MKSKSALQNTSIKLANWTSTNESSILQEMLKKSTSPDIISFALGLPASEYFPIDDFKSALEKILTQDERTLQYQPPLNSLKEHIVELMKLRGVTCDSSEIFLTTGAQQGANLLVSILLDRKQKVILEEKTYTGFQQILKPFTADVRTVKSNYINGIDTDDLESKLKAEKNIAFLYIVADGHNPLSYSLSYEKRQKLAEIADKYNLTIIEDDPYGFINYSETNLPALKSLNKDKILYVGTFSKILAPSLRCGWVIVPKKIIPHLENVKEANDINMAPLGQHLVNAYLDNQILNQHLEKLKTNYKSRRDVMTGELRDKLGDYANFEIPSNGLFIWVEFDKQFDTENLLNKAIEKYNTAYIPGNFFNVYKTEKVCNSMRLNFSACNEETIKKGIGRLGELIKSAL